MSAQDDVPAGPDPSADAVPAGSESAVEAPVTVPLVREAVAGEASGQSRRRPAMVALSCACVVLLAAAVVFGVLYQRENAARADRDRALAATDKQLGQVNSQLASVQDQLASVKAQLIDPQTLALIKTCVQRGADEDTTLANLLAMLGDPRNLPPGVTVSTYRGALPTDIEWSNGKVTAPTDCTQALAKLK